MNTLGKLFSLSISGKIPEAKQASKQLASF